MKNMLTNTSKKIIFMMSLLASTAVLISCGDDDGATPPDPDPATVNAGFTSEVDLDDSFTYTFTNTSVILGIDDLTGTYAWDFGGDGTSTEKSPVYTFTEAGSFEVILTVTAADETVGTASATITVTAPKNKWASITDAVDGDTGELRIGLSGADSIRVGRLTFMYRVAAGVADGFINISGTSTSGDDAIVEVRIKDDAAHEWREGADAATISSTTFPDGVVDTWVPVEISWAAAADPSSTTPTFSVTWGGTVIVTDAVSTTNGGDGDVPGHIEATKNGAFNFQWKYNQNSGTDGGTLEIDDIVLYSSDSGSEVIAFSDDFQGYQTGTNLNPGDNEATPYHANTIDATVAEEE
jgi:PKD repeat protein